jgi:two-component system sensor histidine kinase ArlS
MKLSPAYRRYHQNEQRQVERDTIDYRILSHTFKVGKKNYLLEIGKSTETIGETTGPLQNIAFQILLGMILLTILADQMYSNYILRALKPHYPYQAYWCQVPQFTFIRRLKPAHPIFSTWTSASIRWLKPLKCFPKRARVYLQRLARTDDPNLYPAIKIENMFEQDDIADEIKVRLLEMQKILNRSKALPKRCC